MDMPMDTHEHSGHAMMNIECDGTLSGSKKGTWKGHIFPGTLFIVWGSWWVYSVLSYLIWSKTPRHFRSRSWYPFLSRYLRLAEPIIKVLLPPLVISVELYLDHPDGFRYLRCPEGTKYAGRFALSHMNNWQHASTYPAVILSGLVDLLSTKIPMPQGTGHIFLAASFAIQAFVMGTHEKHEPQDKMVHWLLFLTMLLCLFMVLTELHAPRNPLPALGRGVASVFQGAWLCQIGKIEFENLPQWSEDYAGGAMIAPIYFVTIGLVVLAAVTSLALLMAALKQLNAVPLCLIPQDFDFAELSSPWNDHPLSPGGGASSRFWGDLPPSSGKQFGEKGRLLDEGQYTLNESFESDSARDTEGSPAPSVFSQDHGHGPSFSPFQIMHPEDHPEYRRHRSSGDMNV